jgi:hypothetical protein
MAEERDDDTWATSDRRPANTYSSILPHPRAAKDESVEIAIVLDHRFAFYYWEKWKHENLAGFRPPVLVSLDWHEDLAAPDEQERAELIALDSTSPKDVGHFCWEGLNPLNDGHVLAAAFLGLLSDVYVVRKQEDECVDNFVGNSGEKHGIHCYRTIAELCAALKQRRYDDAYFDIDLDYFTESPSRHGGGDQVKIVSEEEIRTAIAPSGDLMQWLFPRLRGMTIAMEPEFCGGIINAGEILRVIDKNLFSPQLLSAKCGWVKGVV